MCPVDFRQKLREQLGFLERSCGAFDAGYHDEAIRIAQCIRVLMRDTRTQTSLLTHLNARDINLLSICFNIAPRMQRGVGGFQTFNGMGRASLRQWALDITYFMIPRSLQSRPRN